MNQADPALKTLPFVAPCRAITASAPIRWLRLGWRDLRAAPLQSLGWGVAIALLCVGVAGIALKFGTGWLVLVLLPGFVFIAPVLAIGLYSISRSLERGERPTLGASLSAAARHVGDVMVYCLILMVVCLIWVRAGSAVEIFFPQQAAPSKLDLALFFVIGSLIGGIFALMVFTISAFSLPMLLDRRTDAVTAVVTSTNAVLRNRPAMVVWAVLIAASVALGFVTAFIGLAITLPLIGHATWHAYRETIDASGWPSNLDN